MVEEILSWQNPVFFRLCILHTDAFPVFSFMYFASVRQRNWVFATNIRFEIPKSIQPDVVSIWNFKLCISLEFCLKHESCTPSGCKDIGIWKFALLTKLSFFQDFCFLVVQRIQGILNQHFCQNRLKSLLLYPLLPCPNPTFPLFSPLGNIDPHTDVERGNKVCKALESGCEVDP